ncbi:MAG: hypothetical protein M3441_06065 [Chloroflexota bacterium]|nr:hypothetical protein [Chloroflexota bacterium]
MQKRVISAIALVLVTMVLTSIFQPLAFIQALAQSQGCRVFPETRMALCGRFLSYWDQHGGLYQFGYPITNEFRQSSKLTNKEYTVQYFQRTVFEYHPENKPPYDVLLSLLGAEKYQNEYCHGHPQADYPLYPTAEKVQIERDGNITTTSFETPDSPTTVRAYYSTTLPQFGWERIALGETRDTLRFGYRPYPTSATAPVACPHSSDPTRRPIYGGYMSAVETKAGEGGRTGVTVTILEEIPPHGRQP